MIDENLMDFIKNYPKFMKTLMLHNLFNFPLKRRLRSFNQLLQKSKFSFEQSHNILTEYYDATTVFRTNYMLAYCPVEINISRLRKKVINRASKKIDTNKLFDLVPDSTKSEYISGFEFVLKDEPILVLQDKVFDCQIIDGNHRVINNYYNKNNYTNAILLDLSDIFDCIDNNIYKEVVNLFNDIYCII